MQHEKNPFDRDPQSVPLIRFMLHTNSLSSEMLLKDSPAYRLVKLNCFKEVEIMPLPTDNNDIRAVLNTNGLVCTEYYSYESSVGLKASDGSIYNVVSRSPKNIWEPIISDSGVALADLFASNICDYLVVGATEPSLKCKVAGDNILTAEQALEMVRIILTAHGRFCIRPKETVNEGFYYLYRFKNLFMEFQHAWTVTVYAHGKGLPEKVFEYLDSLGRRLEFICRAYDKVAFFSLKTANNDTQDNQLYHLAYFIMLITGAFDDLAHIIKEYYQLRINDRWDVSLRIPQRKETTRFYQTLQSKNAALHTLLTTAGTQREINALYPIRDSLQHRDFLKGLVLHDASPREYKNLFELSDEAAESLVVASIASNCIVRLHKPCLDPLLFITWARKVLAALVNGVLSSIDWDSVYTTLSLDIQDKIHASNESFQRGVSQFLGWPEEPLYF